MMRSDRECCHYGNSDPLCLNLPNEPRALFTQKELHQSWANLAQEGSIRSRRAKCVQENRLLIEQTDELDLSAIN